MSPELSHSESGVHPASFPRTIEWIGDLKGHVRLIDQTRLPGELVMVECHDAESVWQAIRRLSVRGAPAIGIAGAMGAVLGVRDYDAPDGEAFLTRLGEVCAYLQSSRPTGANLSWALRRIQARAAATAGEDLCKLKDALLSEARQIRDDEAAMCRAIGQHGQSLIEPGAGVLTHCNAGALATAGLGTALAPLYVAHGLGRRFQVYATETRPLLQGSRLTAWELNRAGIAVTVICDSMAGTLMREGKVNIVLVGADCIAANGDVANKIGTYSLAVLARHHQIPFYVAAPSGTFDRQIAAGSGIPIEERDPAEIRCGFGETIAPPDVSCFCPAFDVTPASLVGGILTEKGLVRPVNADRIRAILDP